ncbi:MAG: hypothetical protein ACJ8FY_04445 [Gemmataceae bacterium]
MTSRKPLYSSEEFSRRAREIYDRVVAPMLRPEDDNQFVAIDIQSGEYEKAGDDLTAIDRLLTRHSDVQIWLARVGQPAAYRIGGRFVPGARET